jgi:ribonuclease HI
MAKKNKAYVVWVGRNKGIYDTWDECKNEVDGYFGAKYMGFKSKDEAKKALEDGYKKHWGTKKRKSKDISESDKLRLGLPIKESISVDGAWNTRTGYSEYQGVLTKDKKLLFHKGPFEDGTNNIVEFLAIVHALSYCKKHNINIPIYSDSKIAINWVKKKNHSTDHQQNQKNKPLFDLLERANKWLKENEYPNQLLKWETKAWGENPADFGRK